jgi:hypothetical protein
LGTGYKWQPAARGENTRSAPLVFQDAQGWVVQLKYGARVVPLDADNNAVIVQSLDDVAAVLDLFAKAVEEGELDGRFRITQSSFEVKGIIRA